MKKLFLWLGVLLLLTSPVAAQVHFSPVAPTGLPYAVVFQNATLDGDVLVAGDEIGVFDGDICVGAGVIGESWPLSVTTWQADASQGLEGFTSGHPMTYFVYDASADVHAGGTATYLAGDGTFGFGVGTNISQLTATSGGADEPDIWIFEDTHDFGEVGVYSTSPWSLYIENQGTMDLEISGMDFSDEAFYTLVTFPLNISPSGTSLPTIYFQPQQTGEFEGTITIYSNDPDESEYVVTLTGSTGPWFNPVEPTGLPYAVVVQNAQVDEVQLEIGDEIAVFDDGLCVGAGTVDGNWPLSITTWQADASQGLEGFTSGHPMQYRVYDTSAPLEMPASATYLSGDGTFGFGVGTNISLLSASSAIDQPDIFLSSEEHDFGEVTVGDDVTWQFTITNVGTAVLNLTDGTSDNEAFGVDEPADVTLDPEQQEVLTVHFAPESEGEFAGSIAISSNDPDEPVVYIAVSGSAIAAPSHFVSVPPTGLPYAIVVQGATLDENDLVAGDEIGVFDGELCVGSIVLDGDWPASITAWQADGSQGLEGFTSGNPISFRIWSEDNELDRPAEPTYTTGDGTFGFGFGTNVSMLTATTEELIPDIFIEVSTHDFSTVTVGESRDWNAVIQNIGNGDLVISQVLSNNEAYTTSGPVTIEPEGTGSITITFAPTLTGLQQGIITLVSNDPDESEVNINLQGVGTPAPTPDIHIEESFYDFENVVIGESGSWMMQVLNLGTADLTLSSVYTEVVDTFTVVFTDPVVIAPETFAEIEVVFTPSWNQQVMGRVHVISDDPDEEDVTVDLQGRGVSIPNEFSLIAPELDSVVTELPLTFNWFRATDDDPGDVITYALLLAEDEAFALVDTYAVGVDSFYAFDTLPDNATRFWKVLAYDTMTDGHRESTESWSFTTDFNDPPSAFALSTPFDSTWVPYFPPLELNFSWEASSDPDDGAELLYSFFGHVTYADLVDTTVSLDSLVETSLTLNIPDSLLFTEWDDTISVEWWVEAISQGDTTESDDRFHLFFAPSLGVDEWSSMPIEYGIKAVYPNPFNPTATVVVDLPMAAELRVELFNLLGQRVALLGDGFNAPGHHRYVIDGHNLASGVYFVRCMTPGQAIQMRKVVLMR